MRNSLTAASLVCLSVFLSHPAFALPTSSEGALTYTVEVLHDTQPASIRVTLSFISSADTTTTIVFPSNWGGPLFTGISNIELLSSGTRISDTDTNFIKIIHHQPRALISIRYVVQEVRTGEITIGNRFLPVIRPEYIVLLGHGYLAHPRMDEHSQRHISFTWENVPTQWTISTPFGTSARQEFTASMWQVKHAVYAAGTLRTVSLQVRDRPITLSVRGDFDFSDSEFARVIQPLMTAQRELWHDFEIPHYSLVALMIDSDDPAGSSFYGSSILFLPQGQELNIRLKKLLAHELFHFWIGGKIVRAQPENELLWFSEGFANYYARLTLLRSGIITLDEYVEDYNDVLEQYSTSPVRTISNQQLAQDFYRNSDVNRLAYQRGDIFAHQLNAAIRAASNDSVSLDDVMRDLLQIVQEKNELLTHEHLGTVFRNQQVHTAPSLLQSAIHDGDFLVADEGALGPCFKAMSRTTKKYFLFGESFIIWNYLPREQTANDCQSWFMY